MYYATLSPCCDAPMESNCPTCRDPHCKECGLPVYPDMRPEHEIKLTDTTAGVQWNCSSCPAWGLSPNKDGAKAEAANHVRYQREEAKS